MVSPQVVFTLLIFLTMQSYKFYLEWSQWRQIDMLNFVTNTAANPFLAKITSVFEIAISKTFEHFGSVKMQENKPRVPSAIYIY